MAGTHILNCSIHPASRVSSGGRAFETRRVGIFVILKFSFSTVFLFFVLLFFETRVFMRSPYMTAFGDET